MSWVVFLPFTGGDLSNMDAPWGVPIQSKRSTSFILIVLIFIMQKQPNEACRWIFLQVFCFRPTNSMIVLLQFPFNLQCFSWSYCPFLKRKPHQQYKLFGRERVNLFKWDFSPLPPPSENHCGYITTNKTSSWAATHDSTVITLWQQPSQHINY